MGWIFLTILYYCIIRKKGIENEYSSSQELFLINIKFCRVFLWLQEDNQKGVKPMSDLLTVSEVAQILRVDDTTVRRWVKLGALKAVALPHVNKRQAYRIKKETVDALLGQSV